MRPVQILICHHHDATIAESLDVLVLLTLLKSKDLLDRCQLLVLVKLLLADILDVEQLASERKDAPLLTSYHLETCDGARGS